MVDGDDTYPMENAGEMAKLVLERKSDMVVGDRLSSTYFEENKRPFHNMGNSLVRARLMRFLKRTSGILLTSYRAFSYRFVKDISGYFQEALKLNRNDNSCCL